jgi:Cu(I)/Ag(I) efflux system membrane fusion protein
MFKMREIELGPSLGENYVVTTGLSDGEEIITNGTFSVDAAAQLAGKPSMMNTAGGFSVTGHDHGGMTGDNVKSTVMLSHEEFRVEGNCEMCKERIETAAKSVHGVESADWNIETKKLHISYDKSHSNIEEVKKAIAAAGHDNGKYRASDEDYNKLPECCLYRK